MTAPDPGQAHPHEDAALFREAVNLTAAETGFSPQLVEKDYFCTVLLRHLAAAAPRLVFKGGTCLAKVHAGFYRLSEDLDVSEDRLAALRPQVDGQLKPVLRNRDLAEFDLERACALVSDLAARVKTEG